MNTHTKKALFVLLLLGLGIGLSVFVDEQEKQLMGPKGMALDHDNQLYIYSDFHLHKLGSQHSRTPISDLGFSNHFMDFLFLPDGQLLVSESPGTKLFRCQLETKQCHLFASSDKWLFVHLTYDPKTKHIVTAGNTEPTIRLYSESGALLAEKSYEKISNTINDLSFAHDGRLAIAFAGQGSIILTDSDARNFGEKVGSIDYMPIWIKKIEENPERIFEMFTIPRHPMSILQANDGRWWIALTDGMDSAATLIAYNEDNKEVDIELPFEGGDAGLGNIIQLPSKGMLLSDPYHFNIRQLSERHVWIPDFGPDAFGQSLHDLKQSKRWYNLAWYASGIWVIIMLFCLLRLNEKNEAPQSTQSMTKHASPKKESKRKYSNTATKDKKIQTSHLRKTPLSRATSPSFTHHHLALVTMPYNTKEACFT